MLSVFAPFPTSRTLRPTTVDREFNRLLEGLHSPGGYAVAADVTESEDGFEVTLDLPGVTEKDVEVTVDNNVLTVRASRHAPAAGTDASTPVSAPVGLLAERAHGTATRSFRLPRRVDGEATTARFDHGVLTVRLPKRSEAKPRTIEVKVGA